MIKKIPLKVKKIHPDAIIPKYQSKMASGFDLHSLTDIVLEPDSQIIIRTGLCFCIEEGYELQIRSRSGLAAKYRLSVTNSPATIDSDYLDELKVILNNPRQYEYKIKKGDRIAQCVLAPVIQADIIEVDDFTEEDKRKDRGGGLGSTGK